MEILYVPLDKYEEDFKEHYAQMPWLSLPYGDDRIDALRTKYTANSIPILIVVESQTGFLVTPRGRKDIHEQKPNDIIRDWSK